MLLELQISISRDEDLKPLLAHFLQQLAISNSAPAHALH